MANNDVTLQVVTSPTSMADIRFFFRPVDVDHMGAKGIGLGVYDSVKRNALAIFTHAAPPHANMPTDPAGTWSSDQSQTFKNWLINGYPRGSATPQAPEGTVALCEDWAGEAGDDAQLLAGATLAAFAGSTSYDLISQGLNDALDASWAADPIWSLPKPDPTWINSAVTATEKFGPSVDIAWSQM